MDPRAEHLGVALGEGAGCADLPPLGRVVHQELGLVDLFLEPAVDLVEVFLFDTDLAIPYGIAVLVERGLLMSLSGHRAPF